jgi:Tol biopolymer transport system component
MRRRCSSAIVAVVITILAVPVSAQAAFPGTNGSIAFSRNDHVWIVQPDGTQVQLGRGTQPAWSPDGTRIAYMHGPTRRSDIWTMRADGTGKTPVTSGPAADSSPGWSPDGTKILFASRIAWSDPDDLYTIGSEAPYGEPVALTDTPDSEGHPVWSPDGATIAFSLFFCTSSGCGLAVASMSPDGQDLKLLTEGGAATDPDWNPDSASLLFTGNEDNPYWDVNLMTASGGGYFRILVAEALAANTSPAWSPDGTRFVFVHRSPSGRVSLQTAASDGSSIVRLCRGGGSDNFFGAYPDWQPLT